MARRNGSYDMSVPLSPVASATTGRHGTHRPSPAAATASRSPASAAAIGSRPGPGRRLATYAARRERAGRLSESRSAVARSAEVMLLALGSGRLAARRERAVGFFLVRRWGGQA